MKSWRNNPHRRKGTVQDIEPQDEDRQVEEVQVEHHLEEIKTIENYEKIKNAPTFS